MEEKQKQQKNYMQREIKLKDLVNYLPGYKNQLFANNLLQCKRFFIYIDKNQNIDLDCLFLFDLIRNAERLEIDIQNSNYSEKYLENLAQGFKCLTNLNELTIYFNDPLIDNNMFKALNNVPQIKQLSIYFQLTSFSTQMVEALSDSLEKFENLVFLKFNFLRASMNGDNFYILHQSINKLKQLEIFHMQDIKGRTESALEVKNILKDLINLTELQLNISNINQSQIEGSILIVKEIGKLSKLTKLNLQINFRNNSLGLIELSNSLSKLIQLKTLWLLIQDESVVQNDSIKLAQSLEQLVNLENLILEINLNNLGSENAVQIGNSLKKLKNLKILNLIMSPDNNIGIVGACGIGDSFNHLQNLQNLKIKINQNDIGYEGAIKLGQGFQGMVNLQSLDLCIQNNKIQSQGAIGLGEGLKFLANLTSLRLKLCKICDIQSEGAIGLGNGLKYLKNLSTFWLFLDLYDINDTGLIGVSEGIGFLTNLKKMSIALFCNKITQDGYSALGKQLSNLQNVSKLQVVINDASFDEQGIQSVVCGLQYLKSLKYLFLTISAKSLFGITYEIDKIENLQHLSISQGLYQNKSFIKKNLIQVQQLLKSLSNLKYLYTLNIPQVISETQQRYLFRRSSRLINLQDQEFF